MNDENSPVKSLDPARFVLWTPDEGRTLAVGAERQALKLSGTPLPIHVKDMVDGAPEDDAVGSGLYDYLRQFPDCPFNTSYAELLRDGFPHYLADIGAQIVMLEHKEVDPAYVRRKLSYLKILLLLEPINVNLLWQLGQGYYELGLTFTEMPHARQHLTRSMSYLQQGLALEPADLQILNLLAQVDLFFGDQPAAIAKLQRMTDLLNDAAAVGQIREKIVSLKQSGLPESPLVDDLEAIGASLELYAQGDYLQACGIMERLEEAGRIVAELPTAQFFYLLGMCRRQLDDTAGAFEAFDRALEIEPGYQEVLLERDKILDEG